MVKKPFTIFFLLISVAGFVLAEAEVSVKLDLQTIMSHDGSFAPDPGWSLSGTGTADLSVRSVGKSDVKGELLLRGVMGTVALLDIQKAYIKARFPSFRLVAGKTALDWGEGFVFNAADLIAGTLPSAAITSISAETLRTSTDWLTSAYVPVGRFSFLEGVILAPELDTGAFAPSPIDEIAAGARAQVRLGSVASEVGYLYNGVDNTNNLGISFQGNLLIDWNIAASASLHTDTFDANTYWPDDFIDSLEISFGLFHTIDSYALGSVSIRIEGLVMPDGDWEPDPSADYGIVLYGDIGWSPMSSLSVSVRSVYSPVDSSAFISSGVSLGALPGFTAYLNGGIQLGEEDDAFTYGAIGDVVFIGGLRFSY